MTMASRAVWATGDGGTTWTHLDATGWPGGTVPAEIGLLAAAGPSDVVASGPAGLFVSHDGGHRWQRIAGVGQPWGVAGRRLKPVGPRRSELPS
jgi:photosystem II stability/assembly factor-like uncharacterized protein